MQGVVGLEALVSRIDPGVAAHQITLGDNAARAGLAVAFGAVIGLEREVSGHPAGARTHALLSLGAALFGIVSVQGFSRYFVDSQASNVVIDVSRVASYVAAAVGFIGAGVITKVAHGKVQGLTTSASLWVACAVGLACGLGVLAIAGVVTVMALVTLLFSRPIRALERRLGTRQSVHIELVGADVSDATDLLILRGTLSDLVDAATVTTGAGPPPSLFVDGDLRAEQIADVLSSARDNGFSATVGPGHTGVS